MDSLAIHNGDKMIKFSCQSCGAWYEVDQKYAGKKSRCRKCNHALTIPHRVAPADDLAAAFENLRDYSDSDSRGGDEWKTLCTTPSGNFKFPNYSRRTKNMVQITDTTDFKEVVDWDDLEPDEKREYSIDDFENDCCLEDVEVDDFTEFIANKKNPYLGDLKVLQKSPGDAVSLIEAMLEDETCSLNPAVAKKLAADSYVYTLVIPEEDIADRTIYHLTRLKVPELNKVATEHGYEPKKTKKLTAEHMVSGGYRLEVAAEYVPAPKFIEGIEELFKQYLEEVEISMRRFPPSTHDDIWQAVEDTETVFSNDYFQPLISRYRESR